MSFVDILPVEVVHDIFVSCGIDVSDFTADWSTTTSLKRPLPTYPTFLTRVSKSWANAALTCRPLWSTISARIGEEGGKCWPPTDVIETWIKRAGNTLLSISVMPHVWQQDGMYCAYSPTAKHALESIFIMHHSRWRRVFLWYSPTTFHPADLQKRTESFAALESLSIWGILDNDSILHLLSNAPRLHILELEPRGPRHRYRIPALLGQCIEDAVPWNQMKEIRLGVLGGKLDHAEEVLQLLQICPQLEAMTISMVRSRMPDMMMDANIPLVHHDCLKELDLGQSTQDQCFFFLNLLTLPNLTTVALNPASDYDYDFNAKGYTLANSLASFVARSGCEIRELTLRRPKTAPLRKDPLSSTNLVLHLLPIVSPSVVRLFIEAGKTDISDLIDYLTLAPPLQSTTSSSYSFPCPQLRHLTLILWPDYKAPQAVDYYLYPARLFRLIQSRWSTPPEYACDVQVLESIVIQILVKEDRRRAGNAARTSSNVAIQRLIDGMKEHSGRLKAMSRAMKGRRLRLSVVAPPRQLYSQFLGARR